MHKLFGAPEELAVLSQALKAGNCKIEDDLATSSVFLNATGPLASKVTAL